MGMVFRRYLNLIRLMFPKRNVSKEFKQQLKRKKKKRRRSFSLVSMERQMKTMRQHIFAPQTDSILNISIIQRTV